MPLRAFPRVFSVYCIVDSGVAEAVFLAEATKSGDYELCFVNDDEKELAAVQRAEPKAADGCGFPSLFCASSRLNLHAVANIGVLRKLIVGYCRFPFFVSNAGDARKNARQLISVEIFLFLPRFVRRGC